MLWEAFSEITSAICDACREVYGPRLVGVVVYGSVARKTMRPDSDIDVLIVAEPLPDSRMPRMDEWKDVALLCAPALEQARAKGVNTWIAPIIWTPDELPRTGFIKYDIATEGVVLYDADGRVERILTGLRDRLVARGAIRASFRGMPYWILEPNVRPGQVVDI